MGLLVNGSKATEIEEMPDFMRETARGKIRQISDSDFLEFHASGTLRKNSRLGFNIKSHLLNERVAFEFGYEFECLPERYVTWGEARSEGDCKAITEAGWFIDRYASISLFPGDEIEAKYIIVEIDGIRKEGIGLVVRKTSASFIPKGYMIFAIIAEYDFILHDFKEAKNPC